MGPILLEEPEPMENYSKHSHLIGKWVQVGETFYYVANCIGDTIMGREAGSNRLSKNYLHTFTQDMITNVLVSFRSLEHYDTDSHKNCYSPIYGDGIVTKVKDKKYIIVNFLDTKKIEKYSLKPPRYVNPPIYINIFHCIAVLKEEALNWYI